MKMASGASRFGRCPLLGAAALIPALGTGPASGDRPAVETEILDAPLVVKPSDEIFLTTRVRNISDDPVKLLIDRGPFGYHTDYMVRVDRPGAKPLISDFPHGRDEKRPLPSGAAREDRFSIYDRVPDLPPGTYSISVAPILVAGDDQFAAGWSAPVRVTVK